MYAPSQYMNSIFSASVWESMFSHTDAYFTTHAQTRITHEWTTILSIKVIQSWSETRPYPRHCSYPCEIANIVCVHVSVSAGNRSVRVFRQIIGTSILSVFGCCFGSIMMPKRRKRSVRLNSGEVREHLIINWADKILQYMMQTTSNTWTRYLLPTFRAMHVKIAGFNRCMLKSWNCFRVF